MTRLSPLVISAFGEGNREYSALAGGQKQLRQIYAENWRIWERWRISGLSGRSSIYSMKALIGVWKKLASRRALALLMLRRPCNMFVMADRGIPV